MRVKDLIKILQEVEDKESAIVVPYFYGGYFQEAEDVEVDKDKVYIS